MPFVPLNVSVNTLLVTQDCKLIISPLKMFLKSSGRHVERLQKDK